MNETYDAVRSRRSILKAGLALGAGGLVYGCTPAVVRTAGPNTNSTNTALGRPIFEPPVAENVAPQVVRNAAPRGIRPELYRRALAALERHKDRIQKQDRIAIADFMAPSSQGRFHLVDLKAGTVNTLLVAHGSGSDPEHSGFLQRFSNAPGSNATCEGAFLAADYYVGKHGSSQRLLGLDPTNNNALDRAIVVHSAWYANREMLATHGKLGRSQGCFAVGESDLDKVFTALGQGRMIYAAKV